MDQAVNHSLAQLKLMAEARERINARQSLVNLQVTTAAVAACMSKEGGKLLDKVRSELLKRI
jgi:hypothetical protein